MRPRARILATGVAIAWLTVSPDARQTPPAQTPPAQKPQTPQKPGQSTVFRTTVDLVQVDVVVVDGDGNPIRGLKAEDFVLRDRRKPQAIATFEEVSHESPADAEPPPAFPPTLKVDVASNRSAQSDRLVVMVLDDLHIYQGRTDKSKDLARQVINSLGPHASMAVLFTSGDHSTQVTEDRSQLLEAVDTLKGRQSFRRPHEAVDKQIPNRVDPDEDIDAVIKKLQKSNSNTLQDFFDNMTQYKTLQDAARLLGADDARRKAFVVVTEGIAKDLTGMFDGELTPCEVGGAQPSSGQTPSSALGPTSTVGDPGACYHDVALRQMMESMRRSSVATYNIDPRGHVSSQDLLKENFPGPPSGLVARTDGTASDDDPTFRWTNPVRQAQNGLKIVAEASGGFAVTDTDDYATGLSRIIQDIDHYYLLGFYPADTSGKGYRPLDVYVAAHPEWTIRFRRGYMPGGPPPPPKNTDPLVALSAGVMPKTDLPLRLTAVPLPGLIKAGQGLDRTARVVASLEITAPSKSLLEADAKLRDEVSYEILVVDDKKSKVMTRAGQAARMVLHGKEGGGEMPDFLIYQVEVPLDLLPGRYDLRASAMSTKLGKGGSVYFTVDVPDFTATPLMISGLTIGYSDGAHVPVGRNTSTLTPVDTGPGKTASPTPPPPPAKILPFDVALDREFIPFDTLRLYCELARAKLAAPVKVTVEMIDAGDKARLTTTRDVPADDPGHIDLDLKLADLEAGPYRVRVTAVSGSQTAQREIGVIVR